MNTCPKLNWYSVVGIIICKFYPIMFTNEATYRRNVIWNTRNQHRLYTRASMIGDPRLNSILLHGQIGEVLNQLNGQHVYANNFFVFDFVLM